VIPHFARLIIAWLARLGEGRGVRMYSGLSTEPITAFASKKIVIEAMVMEYLPYHSRAL